MWKLKWVIQFKIYNLAVFFSDYLHDETMFYLFKT